MNILLFGATGQIGWELSSALAPFGNIITPDKDAVDLEDFNALRNAVLGNKPDLVVNAAAYTAVDNAEKEPERAMKVNGQAPGVIAEAAKKIGAGMIHFSTDYVFDGEGAAPYTEEDEPNPVSVYGATKRAGEEAVIASGAAALVLRTSWIYAARGKNFYRTILRLANEREELTVVDDQTGSPTWARAVADAAARAIKTLCAGGVFDHGRLVERAGLYHLTCSGQTTWHGFAQEIVATLPAKRRPRLVPITTEQYPTPARRPRYSVLSTEKFTRTFGATLPPWPTALRDCANERHDG